MEFLSLSRRRSSARNVPSGEERGEIIVEKNGKSNLYRLLIDCYQLFTVPTRVFPLLSPLLTGHQSQTDDYVCLYFKNMMKENSPDRRGRPPRIRHYRERDPTGGFSKPSSFFYKWHSIIQDVPSEQQIAGRTKSSQTGGGANFINRKKT